MSLTNPFMPRFEDLPTNDVPVFPLPGAIVLPGCDLHLNIFEPRYINMVNDTLSEHRLIAMVQPDSPDGVEDIGAANIFKTGCAGRITSYQETNDGRIMIVLTGVCRLKFTDDSLHSNGYRTVTPDWSSYRNDMASAPDTVDVESLMAAIEKYLGDNDMQTNIDSLQKLPPENLVNTLAMHMPFDPIDKQGLVEAESIDARAKLLIALCEFSASPDQTGGVRH